MDRRAKLAFFAILIAALVAAGVVIGAIVA